jgi:hypothetical protein
LRENEIRRPPFLSFDWVSGICCRLDSSDIHNRRIEKRALFFEAPVILILKDTTGRLRLSAGFVASKKSPRAHPWLARQ